MGAEDTGKQMSQVAAGALTKTVSTEKADSLLHDIEREGAHEAAKKAKEMAKQAMRARVKAENEIDKAMTKAEQTVRHSAEKAAEAVPVPGAAPVVQAESKAADKIEGAALEGRQKTRETAEKGAEKTMDKTGGSGGPGKMLVGNVQDKIKEMAGKMVPGADGLAIIGAKEAGSIAKGDIIKGAADLVK